MVANRPRPPDRRPPRAPGRAPPPVTAAARVERRDVGREREVLARVRVGHVAEALRDGGGLRSFPCAVVDRLLERRVEQERPVAVEREVGLVAPRRGLRHRHLARASPAARALRAGDRERRVEAVLEARRRRRRRRATACTWPVAGSISARMSNTCRFFWRMCSRTSCPQNWPHCGQRSHSTAQRFFTSLVHASVQPRPDVPAREDGLAQLALEDLLRGRRLDLRRDVAVQERRGRDVDAAQEVRRRDDAAAGSTPRPPPSGSPSRSRA